MKDYVEFYAGLGRGFALAAKSDYDLGLLLAAGVLGISPRGRSMSNALIAFVAFRRADAMVGAFLPHPRL